MPNRKPRGSRKPYSKVRSLVRWDVHKDQALLLGLWAAAKEENIELPWAKAAEIVSPDLSADAVQQHMVKVRNARLNAGLAVPPLPSRCRGTSTPKASARLIAAKPEPSKASDLPVGVDKETSVAKRVPRSTRKRPIKVEEDTDEDTAAFTGSDSDEEWGKRTETSKSSCASVQSAKKKQRKRQQRLSEDRAEISDGDDVVTQMSLATSLNADAATVGADKTLSAEVSDGQELLGTSVSHVSDDSKPSMPFGADTDIANFAHNSDFTEEIVYEPIDGDGLTQHTTFPYDYDYHDLVQSDVDPYIPNGLTLWGQSAGVSAPTYTPGYQYSTMTMPLSLEPSLPMVSMPPQLPGSATSYTYSNSPPLPPAPPPTPDHEKQLPGYQGWMKPESWFPSFGTYGTGSSIGL